MQLSRYWKKWRGIGLAAGQFEMEVWGVRKAHAALLAAQIGQRQYLCSTGSGDLLLIIAF